MNKRPMQHYFSYSDYDVLVKVIKNVLCYPEHCLTPQSISIIFLFLFCCRKLSAEDLERKRREMMDEAKQRDEDRENNVKRYKRQEEQEKQREQNAKHDRHAGFIQ